MIEEAHVSFEVAKLFEEKGFNEKCRGGYHCEFDDNDNHVVMFEEWMAQPYNNDFVDEGFLCSAPTHQMAMAWLREVHNIHIEICIYKTSENDIEPKKSRKAPYYTFSVWDVITGDNIDKRLTNDFIGDTYKDAVEAALKYVLKNLI